MSSPTEHPVRGERAGIVVVFYHPDRACVARANRLAQVWPCVVIDNTEQISSPEALGLDAIIDYVANGANLGIATALNQGINRLIAAGCTCALLFDQDSEPSDDLLTELPRLMEIERKHSVRVALLGPAYVDARLGGVAPFIRFGYLKLNRIAPNDTKPIEVDFLITSGSCLNLAVWNDIGPMEDSLFIDFVDLEWCIRARANGYTVLGVPTLRLVHELGGEPVRVFGRTYPGHSPVRHYYLFRNAVALMRRTYVPWSWKTTELVKMPFRLVIYTVFMRPRFDHLKFSLLGLWHGLVGRSGGL
ncbi:glycosyltransferase family 2 protein [Burkholderia multivorans]|uniref:glycosyltransferase family 2 protein n=1 Tax=Burkholderia multivorans TaxID=87883 RepID=UPI001E5CAE15|nr:glycosyltransferase family 2 protein [Burkholderia multivorans]MDN8104050.1 glycosyltransferase family 2 protein [Burkholderia multivorans]